MSARLDLVREIRRTFEAEVGYPMRRQVAEKIAESILDASPAFERETRTLTNGWVQPLYGFTESVLNEARAERGVPPIPPANIRDQQRWVTPWEDQR